MHIELLTKKLVRLLGQELIAIASDQKDEYWSISHFLLDLPEKWALSFVAFDQNKPIGYAICSRKNKEIIHLHHFMVHSNFRRGGFGTKMISEVELRAINSGARFLTLKINPSNHQAKFFYERFGMKVIDSGDNPYRVMIKNLI